MESKRSRRRTRETPLPHLPQEIIQEILSRLPVKSLLRFKCVSKPWRALISSNGFIRAHLEKSSDDKSFERHRIILGNYIVRASRCFLPSFSQSSAPMATVVDFDYPKCRWFRGGGPRVIGSCNGVVCIKKNANNFVLWNPSTRKFKRLPPIIDGNERDHRTLRTSGFGFDKSNNDYRVFGMLINNRSRSVRRTGLVKTYSLKMDSWKKVGVFAFDSDHRGAGTYASGKLHWNRYSSDRVVRGIISFDLENEIFGTVEWPNGIERCFLGPEMIDGCLCCISPNDSKPDDQADYWLLKEDGANDCCWYKFATLERPLHVIGDGESYEYFVPSFVGANGDILCWNGEYDGYTISFKKKDGLLHSHVDDFYSQFRPAIYVESLVGL